MNRFLVCLADDVDAIDQATVIEADDLKQAAIAYAKREFFNLDCPEDLVLSVKPQAEEVKPATFVVYPKHSVDFTAARCD